MEASGPGATAPSGGAGDWASPGGGTLPPRPRPGEVRWSRPEPRTIEVPVPLHPRQGAAILDAGFAVLRTRPLLLLGVVSTVVVPASLLAHWARGGPWGADLASWLQGLASELQGSGALTEAEQALASRPVLVWGSFALELVATFVAGVAVARILAAWYAGREPTTRQALAGLVRRPGATLWAWFVSSVLIALFAVLCLGPGIVPAVAFVVVAPTLAVEGLGGWAACRRSARLVNRRASTALGVWLGAGLVAQLVRLGLVFGIWLLTDGLAPPLAEPLRWGAVVVTDVVVALFSAGTAFFLYLDLRIRTEALDVELDATDAFG